MNDEYLTPRQILSIMLINVTMWIPLLHHVHNMAQIQTEYSIMQTYESSIVEEDLESYPVVYEVFEPVVQTEQAVQVEPVPESIDEPSYSLTEEEIDLLALVTMAEAEGEPEEGKRLVIDTILNRVDSDRFPDTIYDVIYQPNAFTSMWTSRVDRCYVQDDIRQLVLEELESRMNYEVLFFRTDYYHSYGTKLFQVGNHYFSKY